MNLAPFSVMLFLGSLSGLERKLLNFKAWPLYYCIIITSCFSLPQRNMFMPQCTICSTFFESKNAITVNFRQQGLLLILLVVLNCI